MKLASVKYSNTNAWYTTEYCPDNPREILLYTKEFGTTGGYYQNDKWFSFRWQCFVYPIYWR